MNVVTNRLNKIAHVERIKTRIETSDIARAYPQSTPIGLMFELHTRISIELETESIVYVLCVSVWGCHIDD